jgi:hypothetical protein
MVESYDSFARRYYWEEPDDEATVFVARYLRVRPTDPDKNPLPHGRCRLAGDNSRIFNCDDKGVALIPIPSGNQMTIDLEWEPQEPDQNADGRSFYYRSTFRIDIRSKDDGACGRRLTHLGFLGATLAEQVSAYQTYFGRTPTGDLNDIRQELVEWHDGGNYPGIPAAGQSDTYAIRLTDPSGRPIPGSQWSANVAGRQQSGQADGEGWIELSVPKTETTVVLSWNSPTEQPGVLYCNEIHLALGEGDSAESRKLANLGYEAPTLDEQIARFGEDLGYPDNTDRETLLQAINTWHDGGRMPSGPLA